jgi:predicted DNA-binding protein with PD1-like motif
MRDGRETGWVIVLEPGDEAIASLERFAREHGLSGGAFTAIGGFRDAIVGFFDRSERIYRPIPVLQQVEVLSLTGGVALGSDGPKIHAQAVLGLPDGSTVGGHLLTGDVWPTLEVVLGESQQRLVRRPDPATGLALLDLAATPATGAPLTGRRSAPLREAARKASTRTKEK